MLKKHIFALLIFSFLIAGCASTQYQPMYSPPVVKDKLDEMGYVIQAGAFSDIDNAVRLTEKLKDSDLEAYYYREKVNGRWFYRVRFGNFKSKGTAEQRAEALMKQGIIETYFIFPPENSEYRAFAKKGDSYLRDKLIETAKNYLGVPYKWGGESEDTGFDCSGLTMTVYRLNGLNLPRNSRMQFAAGKYVAKASLKKGDLVFFATGKNRKRVSHVGIYAGDGQFIHAPRTGKNVKFEKMSNKYFNSRYLGGRRYF